MASARSVFRCTDCGADQPKWGGRCEACGAWNTLVEEVVGRNVGRMERGKAALSNVPPVRLADVAGRRGERGGTRPPQVHLVLGGGGVPGSGGLGGGGPGPRKATPVVQCRGR